MDLITDLPELEGMTAIAIFVDRLTNMTHLLTCTKELTATQYTRRFVGNIFSLHGMPEVIISDRGPNFVSKFWAELFSILGTYLQFTTSFHSQMDGQSEVILCVLEDFGGRMSSYVEHCTSIWVDQQPLTEFVTNNAVNVNTGYSPFYLN